MTDDGSFSKDRPTAIPRHFCELRFSLHILEDFRWLGKHLNRTGSHFSKSENQEPFGFASKTSPPLLHRSDWCSQALCAIACWYPDWLCLLYTSPSPRD